MGRHVRRPWPRRKGVRLQSRWMIPTGISQRSAKKPPDEGGQNRRKWLCPSGRRSLSGRIRGEFIRTVGRQTGAPERLVSRSGAAHRISEDVFARVGLKAGAGQKRPRKNFAIVSPPEACKKRCQSTYLRACGGRPQSTDRGGDKAGERPGKRNRGCRREAEAPNRRYPGKR